MSWQDDLRQLDSALAEGRISAEDYRRRRDELLASATPAAPQNQPQTPFGQPFRWDAQQQQQQQPQQGAASPDATQVVSGGNKADATQVVSQSGKDSERTQYVRPVTPPPGMEQPPVGWQANQPQMGATPPWGGPNDPYRPMDQPSWIAQGPEVFDDSSSGSKGKKIAVIAGVVVLLAAVAGGVWFFTRGSGDTQGGGDTTTSAQTTTSPTPTDPNEILLAQIPELNAKKDVDGGVLTPQDLPTDEVLSADEAEVLVQARVENVAWRGATKSPVADGKGAEKFSVLVIPAEDETAASELAEQLALAQRAESFINIKDPLPGMPASLVFDKRVTPEVGRYRGMYLSGSNVVLVDITQTPLVQEAALSGSFQDQVKAVLKQFPAVQ
ncbi:hypothetical protein ACFP3R_03535 [Saccharothrix lopnurensis]|uniref:Flagellar basal body-associated protein FliL n=1 Tax=Saccharothrix lopnurensis TaxID=1670621 RepID=A0ABW1NY75_9PSEU